MLAVPDTLSRLQFPFHVYKTLPVCHFSSPESTLIDLILSLGGGGGGGVGGGMSYTTLL